MNLEIRLFGPLSIELDGIPVTNLGTRKAEALLAFIVSQKRPFSREVLADLLWDDRPQKQSLANLRSLLSGLKKQLDPFLIIERHTVSFNHDSDYWLDMAEFFELLKTEEPVLQSLEKAASLYRGDFLEGFYLRDCRGFDEWASLERERLRQLGDYALRELVRYHLEHGAYTEGNQFADQLLKLNNLSEQANQYKMLLLARSGRRNAALQQYESYRQLLDEELGVEPTVETTAVYKRIQSAQATPSHNLPPQATPFVGRSQELADFQQHLIDPTCRLLTLLGSGGMGKTRLALAAAERITQQHPGLFLNGIRFVPLAAVPTPDLLITAVADACGVSLQGQEPPIQQLIAYLQEKEMLLLLDNFEHLFGASRSSDGVDIVLKLLQEAPLLQILVTSRERLHVQEEWVFDLAGLDYPPEQPQRELMTYSAVQLFQQNARRIKRQFAPTEADWAAMAQVCRLLEGMPLGIELAAAWIRDFSCPEIAQQIQVDVDFLATKLRNVPTRHRSLTAVFDYSWALLSAEEQIEFARLSIFRGDFSAQAAVDIAGTTDVMLAGFCSKSLLREVENGRYELHQILHQYATDKLALESEETEKTAVAHMNTYLSLLASQGSGEKPEERHIIQKDLPNIRQAWQEAARRRAISPLADGMTVLHGYFSIQSKFQEGVELFQFALNQLIQHQPIEPELGRIVCDLWGRKARLHIHIGQLETAQQALDEAMRLLPLIEDPERHSAILSYSAITTFYAGDFARATDLMTTSLQLSESIEDKDGIASAYNFLGSCAKAQGDYETAETRFTQAATMYQQLEDDLGTAMAMNNLGNVAQARGNFAKAQAHYLACSDIFKSLNHSHGAATTLSNAGLLALKQEQYDEARDLLSESLALKRAQKDERGTAVSLVGLGSVSVATGEYDKATKELCEAIELSQSSGDVKLTLECLSVLAALSTKKMGLSEAATSLSFILAHQGTSQEVRDNAELFLDNVKAILSEPRFEEAWEAGQKMDLETAVSLFQEICLHD